MLVLASCSGSATQTPNDSAKGKDTAKHDTSKTAGVSTPPPAPQPYIASKPDQLIKDIKAEKVKVRFQGEGTEPFWTVYITDTEFLHVNDYDNTGTVYQLVDHFNPKLKKQVIHYKNGSAVDSATITRGDASQGMGPDIYPYGINIGPYLDGAGDTLYIKDRTKYARDVN